jgi:DNA segregation ATPase FtsK/SpoIIIE-like protein
MDNNNFKNIMKSTRTDMIALMNDDVREFISSFKGKNSKLIENILNEWNSEENQEKMKKSVNDLLNKKVKKEKNKEEKKTANGDKPYPKKNKSAYICFCVSEREEMHKKYPDMDNKSITKRLAEKWNEIKDDEEKIQLFKDMANEDKDRYNKEMSENNLENKSKKGKKNADGPAKNLSAYIHYCKDMRPILTADGSLSNKDIVAEMGRRWKLLKDENPEEFGRFEKMALEDKERYSKEKENNKATVNNGVEEEKEEKVEKKKSEKKKKVKKTEEIVIVDTQETLVDTQETKEPEPEPEPEPVVKKKSGNNGYINYCKKERDNIKISNPNADFKEITTILSKQWKSLSADEQKAYKNI